MSGRVHAEAKAAPKSNFGLVRTGLLAGYRGKQLVSQPPLVQAKLTINQPGDQYEQEADRVADEVMRMPEPLVQRRVEPEEKEKEEMLHANSLAFQITPLFQRQNEIDKKEEPVQTKQTSEQSHQESFGLEAQIRSFRGGGQPLTRSARNFFEPRFGYDFSQVRIHVNTQATELSRALNAQAFTIGQNIFLRSGQYAPDIADGRRLLAHELTHVVQQRASSPMIQRWVACAIAEACPTRDQGERERARDASLQVSNLPAPQIGILISGFNINYSDVSTLMDAPGFATFWGNMVTQQHRWEILGFSDCEGTSARNTELRHMRAMHVYNQLPSRAQASVDRFYGAALSDCVASSLSEEGRRMNRSVVIQITTTIHTPEGDVITVTPEEEATAPGPQCILPTSDAGVTTLSDYVSLIRCAEDRTGYDPRNMLAMLRQLYYGKSWSATATTDLWDNVIPCSPSLGNPRDRLGSNLYGALQNSAEVGGVDVGHVFTGLEAMTCPSQSVSFRGGLARVQMPNEEFATWGGDLGAAAAAHVACGELDASASTYEDCNWTAGQQSLGFYVRHHAPVQDLEGDIDPFVMRANQMGIPCTGSTRRSFTPSSPISEIFYQYYLDPTTSLGRARTNRYHCFLQAIGATIANSRITNRRTLVDSIARRVAGFAYLFYGNIRGRIIYAISAIGYRARRQMLQNAQRLVNEFLTYLENRL